MRTFEIEGEAPFQVIGHSFAASPSAEGYTLQYSADGYNYTSWDEATPSNENLVVTDFASGLYFRLYGNNSKVTITY